MAPRELSTLQERATFLDSYDNFLLDCDGVIWEGDHVIEGVHQTMEYLRKVGKKIIFVTNNATKSRQANKVKFDKLSVQCSVVSPSSTRLGPEDRDKGTDKSIIYAG